MELLRTHCVPKRSHTDAASFVADHIVPLNKGGADVLANKQAAHRDCNRAKSDTTITDLRRRYVTERHWW
jgi:5-methylcytosine-specific restriction endonuclease McrA